MCINSIIEELHWPATSTRSRPRSSQRCSPPGRAAPRGPPPSPSGDSTWCPDIYISSAHSGSSLILILVLFTFIDFPCVAFSSGVGWSWSTCAGWARLAGVTTPSPSCLATAAAQPRTIHTQTPHNPQTTTCHQHGQQHSLYQGWLCPEKFPYY